MTSASPTPDPVNHGDRVDSDEPSDAGLPAEPLGLADEGSEPRTRLDRWPSQVLVGIGVAAVVAVLGFPLGRLWSRLAPWLPVLVGDGGLYYADPEGEQRAAQEGWYILLSIGAGIVIAIAAWWLLRRFRGAIVLAALAVGGAGAGVLAWRYGHNIGRGHAFAQARAAAGGAVIKFPVDLRIKRLGMWHHWLPYVGGDLLYVAIAACLVYLLIAGFTASTSLGTRRKSAPEGPIVSFPEGHAAVRHPSGPAPAGLSSDSVSRPDRPVASAGPGPDAGSPSRGRAGGARRAGVPES